MKSIVPMLCAVAVLLSTAVFAADIIAADKPPNIVIFLADDK